MKKGIRSVCKMSWAEIARNEFKIYARINKGIDKLKDELIFHPDWWYHPEIRYKIAKKIKKYYLTNKK